MPEQSICADSLDDVVQSCVSFVGVELNSASTPLLRYVSGMNQLTARRVYEHRQQNGPFKSRQQLMEVSGLGNATFVQAAGFLKIVGGDQPLDATWIHPENYEAAEKLLEKLGIDPATVAGGASAAQIRELVAPLDRQALAAELGVGQLALDDMIEALCRPGRDPREDLPPPIFRKDVVKFEDLQAGMELRGTVLNVVDFGAFVDVGLSDSGLIHISQLSAGYVRDPHEVVAVGDQVRAWVSAIDQERRRVALTMIPPGTERPQAAPKSRRGSRRRPDGPQPQQQRPQQGPPAEGRKPGAGRKTRCGRRRVGVVVASLGDDRRGPPQRQPRTGTYEKRAPKKLVPITKEMEEGKEYLRSFGDLLQFHKKKKEPKDGDPQADDQPNRRAIRTSRELRDKSREPEILVRLLTLDSQLWTQS